MRGLIAFAGAPGVGKTTTAKAVQDRLLARGERVGYAPEFARDLIARYGYPRHAALQLHAAYQQREAEKKAMQGGMAVTDTTTWFCHLFPSLFNAGTECEQERKVIEDLGTIAAYWHREYTMTIYLPLHDNIEDDGIRDPHASPFIDREMRAYLARHEDTLPNVEYLPEGMDLDQTVEHVLALLTLQLGAAA